jgi:hypothetical protein
LLDEEGDSEPIAVVLAPDGPNALAGLSAPWRVFTWDAIALTAKALRKLALTSSPRQGYLVAVPTATGASICGLAMPPDAPFLFSDDLFLRACAIGPGSLIIERGIDELLRYAAGHVVPTASPPWDYPDLDATALAALRDAVGNGRYHDLLDEIIPKVSATRKGGMLAFITAPGDDPHAILSSGRRLRERLELGDAYARAYADFMIASELDAQRVNTSSPDGDMSPPSIELEDAELASRRSSQTLDRLVAQTGRLSAVDGAVVIAPGIAVAAFGCKVPSNQAPHVRRVTQWPKHEPYDESRHGTRHRAAVSFVSEYEGRFAICVSQDGPVSAFLRIQEHLYCWPMPTPAPWPRH